MAQVTTSRIADIDALVPSWRLSLEAENESPATVVAYTYGTTQLSAFFAPPGCRRT